MTYFVKITNTGTAAVNGLAIGNTALINSALADLVFANTDLLTEGTNTTAGKTAPTRNKITAAYVQFPIGTYSTFTASSTVKIEFGKMTQLGYLDTIFSSQ